MCEFKTWTVLKYDIKITKINNHEYQKQLEYDDNFLQKKKKKA